MNLNSNYLNLYIGFLKGFIELKKPLKMVFDCSNGTAGLILKRFKIPNPSTKSGLALSKVEWANSRFIILNGKPDGNFLAHSPDPLSPGVMVQLSRAVKKHEADLGVIFDADGDRAFFVDNYGRKIPSYIIAHILFLESSPPFVVDILTFKALESADLLGDRKILSSKVGTYFVKQLMMKYKATRGAEYSGHYYFKNGFYFDSGILTAIKVMNLVSKLPYSFSDFIDLLPKKFYSFNFDINVQQSKKVLMKIEKRYRKMVSKINKIDGLTFSFDNWWFNVRSSNTEPLLRFMGGANNKELMKKEVRKLKNLLK